MDHHRQWRPTPRPTQQFQPNLCPSCLIPHFPHCPPPPPPPSSTFHPPPPPPPPPFPYPNFPPHHQHPNSDSDRTFKRPRIDDPFNFSDDQRRLQLIRDHGSNNHHSHHPLPPHLHNDQFKIPPYPPPHHLPFPPQETNNLLNGRVVHNPYPYPYPTDIDAFRGQPPLPSSPPPPLPIDPPKNPPSLFPVTSSYSQLSEPHPLPQHYFHNKPPLPEFSTGFPPPEQSKQQYLGNAQPFSLNQFSAEKPKFVDATQLFRHPHRASRPDHFVIILRGLPGVWSVFH